MEYNIYIVYIRTNLHIYRGTILHRLSILLIPEGNVGVLKWIMV